jgi:hypothetical protein
LAIPAIVFFVVMPAQAGIQALDDQKPPLAAFDFKS